MHVHLPNAPTQALQTASDVHLLDAYFSGRNQEAFAVLVHRHGPLVLRACRRVLGDTSEVDDVFQAAFVVLTRKGRTLARPELLGPWLYGVAARLALKARGQSGRRQLRVRSADNQSLEQLPQTTGASEAVARDVRPVLDEALSEVSETYRDALVLCYLEGKSSAEAAAQLGCNEAALRMRLVRGRDLLRDRLRRRGLGVSAVAVGGLLAQEAAAAGSSATAVAAQQQIAHLTAKTTAAGSPKVSTLASSFQAIVGPKTVAIAMAATLATGVLLWNLRDAPPPQAMQPGLVIQDDGFTGRGLAFSPDGKLLATSTGRQRLVRLWDASTGKELAALDVKGRIGNTLRFSADGRRLAINAVLDHWEVWDVSPATWPTGRRLFQHANPVVQSLWHTARTDGNFSPDLSLVVLSKTWGQVQATEVREAAADRLLATLPIGMNWQFFPDGRRVVGETADNTLLVCEALTGAVRARMNLGPPAGGAAPQGSAVFAVSPDGATVAVGYKESLRFFDAGTGGLLRSHDTPKNGLSGMLRPMATVARMSYSPDGRYLAVGGNIGTEGVIHVWRLQDEVVRGEVVVRPDGLAFDPRGTRLAVCHDSNKVQIWHLRE